MTAIDGADIKRADALLLDDVMPRWDVTIAEHLVVRTDTETAFRAARELDFLTVRTPLLSAAMWVRGVPQRLGHRAPEVPPRLVLGEGIGLPGWLVLGEEPGREVVFGAVGKFWQPTIEWRDVPAEEFVDFVEPGFGKIAANFSIRGDGEHATLLSYECRTNIADRESRRRFARYWRLVHPFVGHIMRATVHTIRDKAEQ
jgi:hypothetical protein